jgi:hypothetical protein
MSARVYAPGEISKHMEHHIEIIDKKWPRGVREAILAFCFMQ